MSEEESGKEDQKQEYHASADADPIKQIIVVRDLRKIWKAHPGKMAGQVAHAAAWFACDKAMAGVKLTPDETYWFKNGAAKIVKRGPETVEGLQEIQNQAESIGVVTHLVVDHGKTVFKERTITCLSLGPARVSILDPIVRPFPLMN
jgi:peptidyl-tRNA hydrolase